MKYIIIIVALSITTLCNAQTNDTLNLNEPKDSLINLKTRLNFMVPDMPAFKALGTDPSTMLRPSSPKDFAIAISNFYNGSGSAIIPQNFSAEITPGLLVKPWYTLKKYQTKSILRTLTKTSLSLGTNKDAGTGIHSLAMGLRTTLFDKGDLRLDTAFLNAIYKKSDTLVNLIFVDIETAIKRMGYTAEDWALLSDERSNKITDSVSRSLTTEELITDFDKLLDGHIETFKKQNWNASRMDFAYALLLQSPDSLVSNISVNKHLFWLTYALRPGKNNTWCQLLFGINNASYKIDSKFYNEFTGNFRFYAGANPIKGFFELQYKNNSAPLTVKLPKETLYLQLGLETKIYQSIWLHFGTGVMNALGKNTKSQLLSNVNLFFTFPENLKLF